jgi:AcrR family transcriptional regulator
LINYAVEEMSRMHRHNTRVRGELLSAWGEVLAEQGYDAATVGDVAARAGMARSSIYRYFSDKEALFFAYVEDRVAAFVEALRLEVNEEGDAASRLRRLVIGELHRFEEAPDISLSDVPETLSREGHERLLACFAPLRELVRDVLEQGRREGSLGVLGVDEAIDIVFACLEVFRVRLQRQWVSADEIADDVADFVLRGLGAPRPSDRGGARGQREAAGRGRAASRRQAGAGSGLPAR